jgi:hypothetical protein
MRNVLVRDPEITPFFSDFQDDIKNQIFWQNVLDFYLSCVHLHALNVPVTVSRKPAPAHSKKIVCDFSCRDMVR